MARRGRFAPTPSGPLHFGSLVAAAGSFLDARADGGEWHVRIDDLDPPRVMPGAEASILATLESLGFAWDGPVVRQSGRTAAYEDALATLRASARLYDCTCSRTDIARAGLVGIDGPRLEAKRLLWRQEIVGGHGRSAIETLKNQQQRGEVAQ